MKLGKYLKANRISEIEFAATVGVTVSAVRKWRGGHRTPSASFMRKIVTATCGQVSPNDFFTTAPGELAEHVQP